MDLQHPLTACWVHQGKPAVSPAAGTSIGPSASQSQNAAAGSGGQGPGREHHDAQSWVITALERKQRCHGSGGAAGPGKRKLRRADPPGSPAEPAVSQPLAVTAGPCWAWVKRRKRELSYQRPPAPPRPCADHCRLPDYAPAPEAKRTEQTPLQRKGTGPWTRGGPWDCGCWPCSQLSPS